MADMNLLDPRDVGRRKIINEDINSAFAKDIIKKLAKDQCSDQVRAYNLATTFWKEDDLKDHTLVLRVQNFLGWPVLELEFASFALRYLSDGYNDGLPHFGDFLDILAREIKDNKTALRLGTYVSKTGKDSVADYYVEYVLRMLTSLCELRDEHRASQSSATAWLGPDAALGDKVWVIYHSFMLLHLEECQRIYADSGYLTKAKIRWKNSRCKKHLTRILEGSSP